MPNFKVQAIISTRIADIVCLRLFPYHDGVENMKENLLEFLRPTDGKVQRFSALLLLNLRLFLYVNVTLNFMINIYLTETIYKITSGLNKYL